MVAGTRRRPGGGTRPDGPLLERAQIVEAAMELTGEVGLGAMSMRQLGERLGVTSMAIYWYFKSRQAVVDATVDAILDRVDRTPPPEDGDWRPWIRTTALAYHRVLLEYPGVAAYLVSHDVPPTLVEVRSHFRSTLRRAGLDDAEAEIAMDVIKSFVLARAQLDEALHAPCSPSRRGPGSDATIDLAAHDEARRILRTGLEWLLDGVALRVESRTPSAP